MRMSQVLQFVLLVGLAAQSGCQSIWPFKCCKDRPDEVAGEPVQAQLPIQVRGLVVGGGPIAHPGAMTLLDAVRLAGGVAAPRQVIGDSAELFVSVTIGNIDYFISTPLVYETGLGQLLLSPGQNVNVVNWTTSDLFRGRKPSPVLTVPLPPLGVQDLLVLNSWSAKALRKKEVPDFEDVLKRGPDIASTFLTDYYLDQDPDALPKLEAGSTPAQIEQWSKLYVDQVTKLAQVKNDNAPKSIVDWDYLMNGPFKEMASTANKKGIPERPLKITFLDGGKPTILEPKQTIIRMQKVNELPIQVPTLSLSNASQMGPKAVVVLHRTINGRETAFVLSRDWTRANKDPGTRSPAMKLIDNVILYDGDVIEVLEPQRMPVVVASLIAPLLRPDLIAPNTTSPQPCPAHKHK